MNADEYSGKHKVFYIIYLIGNLFTLGTLWFYTNLIGYGVSKGMEKKSDN